MAEEEKYSVKVQPRKIIKCPHCGWEYLPGEVLYPENVTGNPNMKNIVRDPLGHILYEDYEEGDEPLAEEHYICDNCNKPFIITVDVKYDTKPENEELDFSEESVSLW